MKRAGHQEEGNEVFWEAAKEIIKKQNISLIAPYPKIFNNKFFQGKYLQNPDALRIQKMYMKGGYNKFLTLFCLPEVGRCR